MTNNEKDQKIFWDDLWTEEAVEYDLDNPKSQWVFFDTIKWKFIIPLLPKPPARVLEVGCGSANISLMAARAGYVPTLVDFSPEAIETAKKKFKALGLEATFVLGEAERLPFGNNSFDVVMSYGLLEHFTDPNRVIQEMQRVLRPGGRYIAEIITKRFSVATIGKMISLSLRFPYHLVQGKFKKAFWNYQNIFNPGFYENSFSAEQYRAFHTNAGLCDVKMFGYSPLPPLYLPAWIVSIYLQFLAMMGWWYRLWFTPSKLALWWTSSWLVWAGKEEESMATKIQ